MPASKADRTFNFSKRSILALPLPATGRVWYWDERTEHLALRLSSNGGRHFYLYRWVGGRPQQKSIGVFPEVSVEEARRRATVLNGAVGLGEQDLQQASGSKRGEWTFGELFDWYDEHYSKKKRSHADDLMQFRLHLEPLKNKRLSQITRTEVSELHTAISEKVSKKNKKAGKPDAGYFAANKALRLVRAIFNVAAKQGIFKGENPTGAVEWYPEASRERRLMYSEMPRFFAAVDAEENEGVRDFVLLSLFTGARKSNVLAMRWDEIDFSRRKWFIPRTKNGTSQVVSLLPPEMEILLRRWTAHSADSEWVFPGTGKVGHMQDPRKGWLRILARAGIKNFRLHDLRRTLGSFMVDSGASLPIIGKALNHLSPSSTQIYARLDQDPVTDAKYKAFDLMLGQSGRHPDGTLKEGLRDQKDARR